MKVTKSWRTYINNEAHNNHVVSAPVSATKQEVVQTKELDLSKPATFDRLNAYLEAKFTRECIFEIFGEDLGRLTENSEITYDEAVTTAISRIVANIFREFQQKGFCHFYHQNPVKNNSEK